TFDGAVLRGVLPPPTRKSCARPRALEHRFRPHGQPPSHRQPRRAKSHPPCDGTSPSTRCDETATRGPPTAADATDRDLLLSALNGSWLRHIRSPTRIGRVAAGASRRDRFD